MNDFYTSVHDMNHSFFNETLNRYRARIINELKLFGKDKNFFLGKKILDIGTGFQGLIAIEMGAESVVNIDINQHQLDQMGLQIKKMGLSNKIKQQLIDLDNNSINNVENYDVGLIFGIVNHLKYPTNAIKHLQYKLNKGGEILIRAYDGESTTRILINEIRKFAVGVDFKLLKNYYFNRYGEYAKTSLHLRDLLDDLYSPIVQNFIIPKNYLINKNNNNTSKDENIRIVIDKKPFNFEFINSTNELFHINSLSKINLINKIELVVSLYDIIRLYKYLEPETGEIRFLSTNYSRNDLMKYLFFLFFEFKFLIRNKN